ncbi:uncharacterized protein LOC128999287 [Macrosteles quadrilineatus]|uniref:uncharacterized protein LOC128999287 n=1 Tax=Macrosteles quadrilineatus TaxID=74068 RepID=UPI0023E332CF|nr:uncharacterized protein LOC128999287 [Macrosteles quadrilineatus]
MRDRRVEVMGVYENKVARRIQERELWELEREKRLILEGKMGIDEAPYIADHPVFVVSKMTSSMLEETKIKVAEKLKPKLSKGFDFDQMKGCDGDSDDELPVPLDQEELEKARILWEMERKIEQGEIFSQEEYEKTKYENPLVKKMRTIESVNELYDLADEILGPVVHHHRRKKPQG